MKAAAHGLIRIVDESGEDYAFSTSRFYPVQLPQNVEKVLFTASRATACILTVSGCLSGLRV